MSTFTRPISITSRSGALACLGPPEHRTDSGDELAGREGLGDVVVGTELEPDHSVDLVVASGKQYDRRALLGSELAADVEAVQLAWQSHVDDRKLRPLACDVLEPPFGVLGLENPVPLLSEVHGDEVRDVAVVLDHHDGLTLLAHRRQSVTRGFTRCANINR